MSSASRLETCKELPVMTVLESWTDQETSINKNRGQTKTVVIAGSYSGKVIFVHNVCSLSEFSKDF